jgi:hypothetical protein
MRWLCGLSLLSLTLLALLGSPQSGSAASPTPTPSSEKDQQGGQCSHYVQTNAQGDAATNNQHKAGGVPRRKDEHIPIEVAPVTISKDLSDSVLTFFTIVFAAGLVVVGGLQVYWLAKQTKISLLGVKTNRLAVKAAQTALRADRPYLLVETPRLNYFAPESLTPASGPIEVKFRLTNCGNRPAIIAKILARLFVAKTLIPQARDAAFSAESFPTMGKYEMCRWVDVRENVLPINAQSQPYIVQLETRRNDVSIGRLGDDDFKRLREKSALLVLHGVVRYGGVIPRGHETEFRGVYNPPSGDDPEGWFLDFEDRPQRENEGG